MVRPFNKRAGMKQVIALITLTCFFMTGFVHAQALVLPVPGQMVPLSQSFMAPALKGVRVYPDDPFRFDFILDKGDAGATDQQLKSDLNRLAKYFLASLTVPEKDLWVNLSPYEKDRIVPGAFGETQMGRDLLAQDYLLKQITASAIYPEGDTGKKFWAKIYRSIYEKYGTTDMPVDTFNKVWIVPAKAVVFEHKDRAFVVESRLKVMLESDYKALENSVIKGEAQVPFSATQELAREVLREIVVPELEKEVNEGRNFILLRQVYQSFILAAWYKKKIKDSILARVYVDRNKVEGVNIEDTKEAQKIWAQYVEAFKKGVYNYIKDEKDPLAGETVPRKYFSGGVVFVDAAMGPVFSKTDIVPPDNGRLIFGRVDLVVPGKNLVLPKTPSGWGSHGDSGLIVPTTIVPAGSASAKSPEQKAKADLEAAVRSFNGLQHVDDVRALGQGGCLALLRRLQELRLLEENPAELSASSAGLLMDVAVDQKWTDVVDQTARVVLAYDPQGLTDQERAAWLKASRSYSLSEQKDNPVFLWITDHLGKLTSDEFFDYLQIVKRTDPAIWSVTGLPKEMTFGIELEVRVSQEDDQNKRTDMLSELLRASLPALWDSARWELGHDGNNIEIRTKGGMPNTEEGWGVFLKELTAIVSEMNWVVSEWNKEAGRAELFKISQGMHVHVGGEKDVFRAVAGAGIMFTNLEKLMSGLAGGRPTLTFGQFGLGGVVGGAKNTTPIYYDPIHDTLALNTLEPPRVGSILDADAYGREMKALIMTAMALVHGAATQEWNVLRAGLPVRGGDIVTEGRFAAQMRNLARLFEGDRVDLWKSLWVLDKKQAFGPVVPDAGLQEENTSNEHAAAVEMFIKSGLGLEAWIKEAVRSGNDIDAARVLAAVIMWGDIHERETALGLIRSKTIAEAALRQGMMGVYTRIAGDVSGIGEIYFMVRSPQGDRVFVQGESGGVMLDKKGGRKGEIVSGNWKIQEVVWSPQGDLVLVQGDSGSVLLDKEGGQKGEQISGVGDIWHTPSWSPQGDRVILQNDLGVMILDKEGGQKRRIVSGIGRIFEVVWSPQGDRVFVRGESGGVTLDKEGGRKGEILADMGGIRAVTWSPQGDRVFVGAYSSGVMLDKEGGRTGETVSGIGTILDAVWSPQGDRVFVRGYSSGVMLDKEGDRRGVTPSGIGVILAVAWSPPGDRIFVRSLSGGVMLGKEGDRKGEPVSGIGTIRAVAWSPQGDRVYVLGDLGGMMLDKEGARKGEMQSGIGRVWAVAWSPQGDQVFVGGKFGGVMLDKEGGRMDAAVSGIGEILKVEWSPQGDQVFVQKGSGGALLDKKGNKVLLLGGDGDVKFVGNGLEVVGSGRVEYWEPFDIDKIVADQAQAGDGSEPHKPSFLKVAAAKLVISDSDIVMRKVPSGWESHGNSGLIVPTKIVPAESVSAPRPEQKAKEDLEAAVRSFNGLQHVDDVRALGQYGCLALLRRLQKLRLLEEKPAELSTSSAGLLMDVAVDQKWTDVVDQTARVVLAYDPQGLTDQERAAWLKASRSSSLSEQKDNPVFLWITDHLGKLTSDEFFEYLQIVKRTDPAIWSVTGLPKEMTFGIELELNLGQDEATYLLFERLKRKLRSISSTRWDMSWDTNNVEVRTKRGMPNTEEGWGVFLKELTQIITEINSVANALNKKPGRKDLLKVSQGMHVHVGGEKDISRVVPGAGAIFTALEKLMSFLAGGRPTLTFGQFGLGGITGSEKNRTPLYYEPSNDTLALNTLEPPRAGAIADGDAYGREMKALIVTAMAMVHGAATQEWNVLTAGLAVRRGEIVTEGKFSAQMRNLARLFAGNRVDLWKALWMLEKKQAFGPVIPDAGLREEITSDPHAAAVELFLKSGLGLAAWVQEAVRSGNAIDAARVLGVVMMWGDALQRETALGLIRDRIVDEKILRDATPEVYARKAWDLSGIGKKSIEVWSPGNDLVFVGGENGGMMFDKDGRRLGDPVFGIGKVMRVEWSPQGERVIVIGKTGTMFLDDKGRYVKQVISEVGILSFALWSPQGDRVYLRGNLGALLLNKDGELQGEALSGDLYKTAWSPQGDRLFINGSADSLLLDRNGQRSRVATSAVGQGSDVAWSPQGDRFFLIGSKGGVLFDTKGDHLGDVALEDMTGAAWSPQGDMVLVQRRRGNVLLDKEGHSQSFGKSTSSVINKVNWSPDGEMAVVNAGSGVFLIDRQGTVHGETARLGGLFDAVWSPAGDRVFVRGPFGTLLLDMDGISYKKAIRVGQITGARWSPQGDRLFVRGSRGGVLFNKNGERQGANVSGIGIVMDIAWSPRDDSIFVLGRSGAVLVNKNGERMGDVLTGAMSRMAWSPQGDRILVGLETSAFLLDQNGRRVSDTVSGVGKLLRVAWSPQGSTAFIAGNIGNMLLNKNGEKVLSTGGISAAMFIDNGLIFVGPDEITQFNPFDLDGKGAGLSPGTHADASADAAHGGIDLNAGTLDLRVQESGDSVRFNLDPAQLQRLQDASGFAPVVTDVHPLESLSQFLGMIPPEARVAGR